MANHTPGPWEAVELIPDGLIIRRKGTYEIRTPDYDVAADVPNGGPFRKLEDAVLAAAAPRLLEALEETYTNLRRWRDEKPELWDAIIDSGMMDAWDKSRAAIEAVREE